MSVFKAGFAKSNINPDLGIPICGYYIPRFAKGFLDDLEARALALSLDDTKVLLISLDQCYTEAKLASRIREAVADATGVSPENIFLSCTHSHTAPCIHPGETVEFRSQVETYVDFLCHRAADTAVLALADLKNAKMGFIQGWAPERIAYIRRYKMKDGSTMTCPPIEDPNIDHAIGELDQRVHVLRFDREGGESVVLVNYGIHSDTIGGELISSDFPGWMRRTLEKALDGVQCMFFPGAQGDVGSTHVFPEGGDMNDTEISFDNEMKSPGMARFVGRALAGTVLQVYDKVEYIPVDKLQVLQKTITVPAHVPKPEDMPLAHKYNDLHNAGRDDLIPYEAMELTTVVAEAARMCRLEHGPYSFDLTLMGVRIGDVVLVGIPGEPFSETGMQIKAIGGYKAIMPCALVNGSQGYFPVKSAFDEGGYEARSTDYTSGVAETLVAGARELLEEMK